MASANITPLTMLRTTIPNRRYTEIAFPGTEWQRRGGVSLHAPVFLTGDATQLNSKRY